MANNIVFDCSQLLVNMAELSTRTETATMMYAETKAAQLKSYMQTNRPWTDRTGQAKRMLNADAEKVTNGIRISLSHGVDYGIWLEFAHEKRYAIIEPTIRIKGPEVMDGLTNLLNRLGR